MPAVDLERVEGVFANATVSAGQQLGVPGLNAGHAGEGTEPHEFIPGDGSRAVRVRMTGLDGDLAIIVGPKVIAELARTPLGADFVASVEPALKAASMVLDQAAPRALRLSRPAEVDPTELLDGAGSGIAFLALPLFDADEEHLASLVLILVDPDLAGSTDDDDELDVAPLAAIPNGVDSGEQSYSPPPVPAANGEIPSMVGAGAPVHQIKMLHDVEMDVTVELGRTRMTVRSILGLTPGSVIELDRAAGAPVDLLVNGTLVGRGEVVVIDEEFGVRISEIVGRHED